MDLRWPAVEHVRPQHMASGERGADGAIVLVHRQHGDDHARRTVDRCRTGRDRGRDPRQAGGATDDAHAGGVRDRGRRNCRLGALAVGDRIRLAEGVVTVTFLASLTLLLQFYDRPRFWTGAATVGMAALGFTGHSRL